MPRITCPPLQSLQSAKDKLRLKIIFNTAKSTCHRNPGLSAMLPYTAIKPALQSLTVLSPKLLKVPRNRSQLSVTESLIKNLSSLMGPTRQNQVLSPKSLPTLKSRKMTVIKMTMNILHLNLSKLKRGRFRTQNRQKQSQENGLKLRQKN